MSDIKKLGLGLTLSATLVTTIAFAHGKATGIVRERMDQMVVLKDAMKLLHTELTKRDRTDKEAALTAAREIIDHSGEALILGFPEGSVQHSKALPSVWTKPERFAELAEEMRLRAEDLTASLNDEAGSPEPLTAFGAIADTCLACHKQFRAE